jgi:hypothetical protein
MLYLGRVGDEPWVIHAYLGYGRKKPDGDQDVVRQSQVGVMPLSKLTRMKPITYLEEIRVIREIDPR